MSLRIGRNPHYLSRAFNGRNPLKFKDVAAIFEARAEHPRAFFNRLYPLGGPMFAAELRERLYAMRPNTVRFDDLIAEARRREPVPTTEEAVERARRLLRGLVFEQERSQREISLALGLGRDTLGQALRGGMDLEMWHVFGVLRVVGVPPERFFRELFAPVGEALPGTTWHELVPLLERLLTDAGEALTLLLAKAQAGESVVQRDGQEVEPPAETAPRRRDPSLR